MELILDIVKNNTNFNTKNNHKFDYNGGIIGRSEAADFILEDDSSYISNKHLEIIFKEDSFFAKDISTNGTYLKTPHEKLQENILIKIEEEMVFIIGEYELQARFFNNEFKDSDLIQNKRRKPQQLNRNIIPDDFSLEDDDNENDDEIFQEYEKFEEEIVESSDVLNEHIVIPSFKEPEEEIVIEKEEIIEEEIIVEPITKTISNLNEMEALSSLLVLEKKLGITISSLTQYERDILLTEISDIVINSLEGLNKSLRIKDDIKIDILKSNRYNKNAKKENEINPIKLGEFSLNLISANVKDKTKIKISEAVSKSYNELDIHNIALHKTTKNLINISTSKFSPKNLEYNFEKTGKVIPYVPKTIQMWTAYKKLFSKLDESEEFGIDLIEKDFIKEYRQNSNEVNITKIED